VVRTIKRLDAAVASGITATAAIAAVVSEKVTILVIGAAVVACSLVGIRILLESMVERIANDSYDSGKGAERRAIVRDLAEYVERKGRSAG
jgi:hypothetical protein